jgi:catechol 2,3-dioxygenase-like lactoylglutathione lyase family enzyme
MSDAQLRDVRLLVTKFPECFRFYRDVFGFRPTWGEEQSSYAEFDAGGAKISLFGRSAMAQVAGAASLPDNLAQKDHVALIFASADVDAVYRELLDKGVHFISEPTDRPHWGVRTVHLRDPDGNLIEIQTDLKS